MAESRRQVCERTVTFSKITEWPQEYQDMIQPMLSTPLDISVDMQYTTGVGCSAKCSVGQKLADCVTPTTHLDACTKIFAARIIEKKYESQFKNELCGHLPKNVEATDEEFFRSDIEYWQRDKEKNKPSSQAAPTTATSTSSDTAPAVESQSSTSSTKTMTVSGTVFDENNEPLDFANIAISGTTKGTITDANGKFELKDVPSNATLLIFFFVYKS